METFGAVYTATPLHDILIRGLAGQGILLSDAKMSMLTFQILFSTYRFQNGHEIGIVKNDLQHKPKWFSDIEQCLNVHYSSNEVNYIVSQMLAIQGIHHEDKQLRQAQKAKKMWFSHVKRLYSIDLSNEQILVSYLTLIIDRGPLSTDQIIFGQTIHEHTFAIALAKEMSIILVKNNLPPLEPSIVTGLAAIITIALDQNAPKKNAILLIDSEEGIRRYSSYRLSKRFSSNLNIIGAYPLYRINDIHAFKKCDFILCTSHTLLEWSTYASAIKRINKDIIFINPSISETDMQKIEQYLNSLLPSYEGVLKPLIRAHSID